MFDKNNSVTVLLQDHIKKWRREPGSLHQRVLQFIVKSYEIPAKMQALVEALDPETTLGHLTYEQGSHHQPSITRSRLASVLKELEKVLQAKPKEIIQLSGAMKHSLIHNPSLKNILCKEKNRQFAAVYQFMKAQDIIVPHQLGTFKPKPTVRSIAIGKLFPSSLRK